MKTNNYTTITFRDKQPIYVSWAVSQLHDGPSNAELIRNVVFELAQCGWKVEISKPQYEDEDVYADLGAKIKVLN